MCTEEHRHAHTTARRLAGKASALPPVVDYASIGASRFPHVSMLAVLAHVGFAAVSRKNTERMIG